MPCSRVKYPFHMPFELELVIRSESVTPLNGPCFLDGHHSEIVLDVSSA